VQYPNLKDSKLLAFDIETKDPNLKTKGPGVYRKDGYILGVGLATKDGFSEYYNLGHKDITPQEKQKNIKYLKETLSNNAPKLGTNIIYDLDWLTNGEYKFKVNGSYNDVQIAEPLIDENQREFNLDFLSHKYLNKGKAKSKIDSICEANGWKGDSRQHLWRMSYKDVKDYVLGDVNNPLEIFEKQESIMKDQGLENIYDIESRLTPLLLQMRKTGVRLDIDKMGPLTKELNIKAQKIESEIYNIAGSKFNIKGTKELPYILDKLGIAYPRHEPTKKMLEKGKKIGNPALGSKNLSLIDHPIAKLILDYRHQKQLLSLYLNSYPEFITNGRLHCLFNALKADDYGTVSGRFSSSKPNLQQVAQLIRTLFIPEYDCDWMKYDWSQIEYRVIAHYAVGEGADEIRARYNDDPKTDYHAEAMERTGINHRKTVKNLNFGSAYGMGWKTMALTFGWDKDYAQEMHRIYHSKMPFIKYSMNKVGSKALQRGHIFTLLKRRARIANRDKAYVMFNRLIQGSAADIMKKSMVDAYEAGVFNVLHPHLTVHDELDVSKPRTKEGLEAAKELKRIMETTVKLRVPIIADAEIGPNWGDIKEWVV
jgi:DNA polymerase-1